MRMGGLLLLLCGLTVSVVRGADPAALWLDVAGGAGPGEGQRVVLVSGDEEYRSEETLPQLAKILARRHGFDCRVLFAIDPADGTIDPNNRSNIPGLEALADADLMVIFTRFRTLPDEQMQHLVDYIESGRPIIGLRTATHAFDYPADSKFARYGWNNKDLEGGFGRQVLGETWINHHGQHGKQSTRGVLAPGMAEHPILRGIRDGDIWGPTDVYGVRLPLPATCRPLVMGQVLTGMNPTDEPVAGPQNDPLVPITWTSEYQGAAGKTARVFTTTMGAADDFASAGLRRLLVNACYWAVGLEEQIPAESNVELVGDYQPSPFKHGGFRRGVKPADLAAE